MRILVVDDDAATRLLLCAGCRRIGHNATACADGESALASLQETPVDVLICDWAMPPPAGADFLRELSARGLRPGCVIVASAFGPSRPVGIAMDAGADDVLGKPIDLDRLAERLAVAAYTVRRRAPADRT
jgi:DNA-binding response OmpR family regulator